MLSPLYIRSVYSLLNGMNRIGDIVEYAKNRGCTSLAIVDKNVLSYAPSFKKECAKHDIRPVYGLSIDVVIEDRTFEVILYARNDQGFKNMMALSSLVNTGSIKAVDYQTLNKYQDDCFLVLPSDNMLITMAFDRGENPDEALNKCREYFKDFMIGLADHDKALNYNRDLKLLDFYKKNNLNCLALHRTLYKEKDDYKAYEVLRCIDEKRILNDDVVYNEGRYFINEEEYQKLYDETSLKNNELLLKKCKVSLDFKTSLPEFPLPVNSDSKTYLRALANEGLKRRLKNNVTKEYKDRLNYELNVITNMNFEDYFLIVYDFILFSKKKGILVGPGRGSCGGSLVCFCLGISEIDPIKYGLIFERFLNPERISMPDIDTDFPDDKRDLVFDYVFNKYGKDHVAHIITYGTLKAKQVLRDVGRVLNYSTYDIDSLCKAVPFNASLMETYNVSPFFRQKIESEEKFKELFRMSLKLEGLYRHESTHAAGVVMSKDPLNTIVPLISIEDNINSTQYTMEHLEELGLIKMDFLGLRNLGIIAEVLREINEKESFDLRKIPLNDYATFKLIRDVNLLGVFQLESSGMMNLARKMKPNNFEELSMMIALFRPGPMENIDQFLYNRANPDKINYQVKELEPILKETYGIIIYQEQIMAIARVMAGFSFGKADILRKAMSKKKESELIKLQDEFISGCLNKGYRKDIAVSIYNLILKFANYGFNKSHSIAYGLLAYQMAYLKANYPKYFYKALLNGVIGSSAKTFEYIRECLSVKVKIGGISLNRSFSEYVIDKDEIIMPFTICKDVGYISANKIILEREKGLFKDYISAVVRLCRSGVERNVLENLICAGAFDEFGLNRYAMLNSLNNVIKYASSALDISLLGDDAPIVENLKDDMLVRAEKEKDVLGFYFTFNPFLELKKKRNINVPSLRDISDKNGYVKSFAMIKRIKNHKTKKGDQMCFMDVYDEDFDMSLVIMPNIYKMIENKMSGKYVLFEGNKDKPDSVVVRKIEFY